VERDGGARIRELQRAITSIRGVRGARVELDASGVGHVRVLVVPERGAHETIRDVRETVLRQFGVDIDPGRIEIVSAGETGGTRRRRHRRRLASLSTERADGRFLARVALDLGGDRLVGASEAPTVRKLECRSVAAAIIDGLSELTNDSIHLDEVQLVAMGEARLAVVVLNRDSTSLVASALVRWDEHDAIARATLHALNRLL